MNLCCLSEYVLHNVLEKRQGLTTYFWNSLSAFRVHQSVSSLWLLHSPHPQHTHTHTYTKLKHYDSCWILTSHCLPHYLNKFVVQSLHVWLFVTTLTVAHQAPLTMGFLQARILEWVTMPSSRGSSQPRNWIQVSCILGGFFTISATRGMVRSKLVSLLEPSQPFQSYIYFLCLQIWFTMKRKSA